MKKTHSFSAWPQHSDAHKPVYQPHQHPIPVSCVCPRRTLSQRHKTLWMQSRPNLLRVAEKLLLRTCWLVSKSLFIRTVREGSKRTWAFWVCEERASHLCKCDSAGSVYFRPPPLGRRSLMDVRNMTDRHTALEAGADCTHTHAGV